MKDSYSGADFPAGHQTLNGSQALSFVRQRHGLDNGDLDRTHRQQAFITSAAHKLRGAGTSTDLGKLQDLIDTAKKDVVISAGWDILSFAREWSVLAVPVPTSQAGQRSTGHLTSQPGWSDAFHVEERTAERSPRRYPRPVPADLQPLTTLSELVAPRQLWVSRSADRISPPRALEEQRKRQ